MKPPEDAIAAEEAAQTVLAGVANNEGIIALPEAARTFWRRYWISPPSSALPRTVPRATSTEAFFSQWISARAAMQVVQSYIRTQGVACAVINAVLNPTIAWLANQQMAYVPLSSIVVDTAVTSLVLSLLVSLFVTPAVRRERRAGQLSEAVPVSWETRVLSHMPGEAWSFGLLTGIGVVVILPPVVFGSLRILGIAGFPSRVSVC